MIYGYWKNEKNTGDFFVGVDGTEFVFVGMADGDTINTFRNCSTGEYVFESEFEAPCNGIQGGHEYAEKTCPACGVEFCYSCCGSQNVDQGGKYDDDYMTCPVCGHDYYSDES